MKILVVFVIAIFLISFVCASCSENQIDINSASAEELDKLVNIGPARAQAIIAMRPFDSVDDLINVNGIGPTYLSEIKEQGLACVEDETVKKESADIEENPKIITDSMEIPETTNLNENYEIPKEAPAIKLNSQTIKSEDSKVNTDKSKYAVYGLIIFCVLLVLLFVLKSRKGENEFEE